MEIDVASQTAPLAESPWAAVLKCLGQWARRAMKTRQTRRLRVRETLSLGERRFLAVIEFDHQEFLVGGTGSSLALMARLHDGKVLPDPSLPAVCSFSAGR